MYKFNIKKLYNWPQGTRSMLDHSKTLFYTIVTKIDICLSTKRREKAMHLRVKKRGPRLTELRRTQYISKSINVARTMISNEYKQ